MVENYREPEDLLSDESFLSWYFKTGVGEDTAWEQWVASSPEHKALVSQAVELLNKTRLREKEISRSQQQRAEAALMEKINALPVALATAPRRRPATHSRTSRHRCSNNEAGPAFIQGSPLDGGCRRVPGPGRRPHRGKAEESPSGQQVATAYGQIRQQQLPDGTVVTMNANSRVSYSSGWKNGADREVWMTGEVIFPCTQNAREKPLHRAYRSF